MESFYINSPQLKIEEDCIRSETFEDIYHSKDGAFEEAYAVFIRGNSLEDKWKKSSDNFSICELGFGLGVSFLETLKVWRESNSKGILYYTSIEAFPVSKEQLQVIYGRYLKSILTESIYEEALDNLLEQYPKKVRGFHRLHFPEWNVILNLIFEDVATALKQMDAQQDAWFLDGFSPRKNPEMWSEETFKQIHHLTKAQGTFSTYSVSKSVKDHAEAAGFTIEMREGFKSKKHSLRGYKNEKISLSEKKKERVAVIGGGISGFSVAHSLCKRGIACTIFEKESDYGLGASSNQAAVLMPLLSSRADELSEFYLNGFLYSVRELELLNKNKKIESLKLNGALRISSVKKWITVHERFADLGLSEIGKTLNAHEINSTHNINQNKDGIFFHVGGSVRPRDVIASIILQHANLLEVKLNSEIKDLNSLSNLGFSNIICANAYTAAFMRETAWLPVEKIKGQLFSAKIKEDHYTSKPTMPICYDGYIAPIDQSPYFIIGSTYEHNKHETEFDKEVVHNLSQRLDANTGLKVEELIEGKVCFRTTSPDRFPMIGRHYTQGGEPYDNIYTTLGHGSRGMVSCMLAGEIIADEILEKQTAVPLHIKNAISPMRYVLRERKRGVRTEESYPASYIWRNQNS